MENPIDLSSPNSPPRDFTDDPEYEKMSYPYPRYNGEADTQAHVHAFLTTWQANHASQRLVVAEANISKIAEFGLSLEWHAMIWYSQKDITVRRVRTITGKNCTTVSS